MRTLNLRVWFPVFITLLLGLVLLLWSALQYRHLVERTQQQQLSLWRDTLSNLQVNISHELLRGDREEAQFLVSQYSVNPDLLVLAVIDHRGKVLLANRYEWRAQAEQSLPGYGRLVHGHGEPGDGLHLDIHIDDKGDTIHATLPVSLTGEGDGLGNLQQGKIYFLYDLTRARQSVRNLLVADMSIMSPLLLLGAALVWLIFQYFISRPLDILRAASIKMSKGQFEPVELKGKGELARLGKSFNEMARRITTEQRRLYDSEQRFRKQAENLNETSQRLAEAQRMAHIGNWEIDLTNEIYWWSEETCRIFEIDPQKKDLTLETFLEAVHPEDRARVVAACEATLENRVPYNIDHRLCMPDGRIKYVQERGKTLYDDAGNALRFTCAVQDITERVSMEEALRRAQKMDAIGQLSGGIAHDFNNQLGIVIGYLDILKNDAGIDDRSGKWIDTATRATLRCMDLTRQLLAFSRKKGLEKDIVDLNAVLEDLETMVSRSVTPEIEVQYFLADELWQTEINAGEFQDAILNLVINARDAMPGGGKLLIETTNRWLDADYAAINPETTAGDYVELMISDTGTGMDGETLERVFEPFFTTKPEGRGTGLGMAMVYGFARRYGGNVKVYSEVGVGTTVRMYLPRATGEAHAGSSDMVERGELPGGSESVLIVDDESDLLQLADQYLSRLGYRTFTAENAPQALQILEGNEQVDILFSDVVMPGGMNGYELAQQATEKRPGIKVLLTSGYTSKIIAHNGLARFSAHMLNKPYREADLARRIRSVLDEGGSK
ncbi:PAS domain S-box-containing protein [Thiogranum longum]|uniref:histidine kinase n=1 Tax=Thiogranum longum TaxID=1537524 RepID=A0A4R1HB01_9GAMM|nr:ATP-binding protein [Thiogranum longum]TCK18538.1 PAS domain S-box-containing protein [Thiogranum longum]